MVPRVRYLILWLTEACNLQCRYCYRPPVATPRQMSFAVLAQALKVARAAGLPFQVQLSGGEPTLVPELIAAAVEQIRPLRPLATLGLQTNATCLTPALVDLLRDGQVQVGVSLDGPPAVHDALRGNFAQTYAGLQLLEAKGVPFRVTVVVSQLNATSLDLLALLLSGFSQARGLGLDLLTLKGAAAGQIRPATPEALAQGLQNLLQTLSFINCNRVQPLRLREADTLVQAWRRQNAGAFCHASRGESLAVAPDGTVYPCGQTCGEPLFALGSIWKPEALRRPALPTACRPRRAACQECLLTAFCPGDCPARLIYNHPKEARLVCVLYQTIWRYWQKKEQSGPKSEIWEQGGEYVAV